MRSYSQGQVVVNAEILEYRHAVAFVCGATIQARFNNEALLDCDLRNMTVRCSVDSRVNMLAA